MRVIVYGLGAIGGVVAGALAHAGANVIAIARGRMLEAVQRDGLRLRTPDGDLHAALNCVASPSDIAFRPDDAILLCMKTQDTGPALRALRDAGVTDQPIFCVQNGVANERQALRLFPNVHGITVMLPATYLEPGEVIARSTPKLGMFDIGRYPKGHDAADAALANLLSGAGFACFVQDDVMAMKYGKLLFNLGNIAGAAFSPDADLRPLRKALQAEGEAVLDAAGIAWSNPGADPERKGLTSMAEIPGAPRPGNSTLQSLQRGGSLETDFLNGEICLLGRLHGVPTPLNAAMMALAARMARDGVEPGSQDLVATQAALGLI